MELKAHYPPKGPWHRLLAARGFYEREYFRLWEVADRVFELFRRDPEGRLEDYA